MNEKIKALTSIMESEEEKQVEKKFRESPNNLPVPKGATLGQVHNVLSDEIDPKIYSYKELADKMDEEGDESPPIPTFFKPIDDLLGQKVDENGNITEYGGLRGGELAVWSAKTKEGKTTFCQTMSYLQSKNGVPSIFFTLELPWRELTKKFRAMDEKSKDADEATNLPIYYPIDNRGLSLEWLENKIKNAQKEYGAAIAYIDHLHFLLPFKDFNTSVPLLIGGIVREIKKIAIRLNIPIVLIVHTKRLESGMNPDIDSLRDSALIACESDFVFMMWRIRKEQLKKKIPGARNVSKVDEFEGEEVYTNLAVVSLEANRRTGTTRRILVGMHNGIFLSAMDYYEAIMRSSMGNQDEIKRLEAYQERMAHLNK